MPASMLADIARQLSHGGISIVYNERPGKGHNGGPPIDDDVPSNGHSPDPNDNKPLVPPIIPGMQIDYDTISTAKPGQATSPRNLAEHVLWNEVIDNPANGSKLIGLNNDLRFPPSNGWQKMEVIHTRPDGTKSMKIVQKDGFNRTVDVYAICWIDGLRHHMIIPYEGYDGLTVVTENNCEIVDNSINNFVLRKSNRGGDTLIHWAAEKDDLLDRLIDPPDAEAVAELKRRLEKETFLCLR